MKSRFIILFVFLGIQGMGQTDSPFHLIRSIYGDFTGFTADNLGNLFLLTRNNQLKKLDAKGDSMGVYNDVRKYGKLYSIDVSNPLKTLLFYKDFRTVIVLDRFLNIVNTIDLRKQNIFQVRAVAQSYDNNVWVFDEQESKLKKIGEDGKLISESADLRQVFAEAPVPTHIFDQNGFVHLYDPKRGMYIFDYYGSLKNNIPLLDWKDVQVIGKTIAGRTSGKYITYTQGSLDLKEAVLPKNIRDAEILQIAPNGIYILEQKGVSLYALQ
jgi:hypothetical protein